MVDGGKSLPGALIYDELPWGLSAGPRRQEDKVHSDQRYLPMLVMILLVFAFVFAVVATLGVGLPRCNFGWLAFAFFVLAVLVGGLGTMHIHP